MKMVTDTKSLIKWNTLLIMVISRLYVICKWNQLNFYSWNQENTCTVYSYDDDSE